MNVTRYQLNERLHVTPKLGSPLFWLSYTVLVSAIRLHTSLRRRFTEAVVVTKLIYLYTLEWSVSVAFGGRSIYGRQGQTLMTQVNAYYQGD